jgi:23S rRNA (uracil1939-C5)-methyltransferase
VLNLHDRPGPYLVGRESKRVAGTGHVKEQSLGPAFLVSPSSFFQTNVAAAATLVRLVIEALPGESGLRVLDLYSGSGLFAAAARGPRPPRDRGRGEPQEREGRRAQPEAEQGPDERLKLVCSAVEKAVPHLDPGSFDAVILDPPREGTPPEVMRGVFERLKPARGILVSCDPEALSRELPLAVAAGYRVLRVQPVDMFPHTPHIEAVAVLERHAAGTRPSPVKPRKRSSRAR